MLRQEILQMPPDEQIILRPGMKPMKAKKIRWYEELAFTSRRRPPPVIPELVVEILLDDGSIDLAPRKPQWRRAIEGEPDSV
jgi:type IV secretion system protein VirD4